MNHSLQFLVDREPEARTDRKVAGQPVLIQNPSTMGLLEKLFPGWVIIGRDNRHRNRFFSSNSTVFFGISNEELRRGTLSDFLARIHPDDQESYHRIHQKVEGFLKDTPSAEMEQYRFGIRYRFQRGRGRYFSVQEEKLFYVAEMGKVESYSIFRDISGEHPATRVQLDIFRVHPLGHRKISSYVPTGSDQAFTSRETEVLQLIKDGLSSKEIADRLSISFNTVRNHRSNLFRKTQSRNMVELLNHSNTA